MNTYIILIIIIAFIQIFYNTDSHTATPWETNQINKSFRYIYGKGIIDSNREGMRQLETHLSYDPASVESFRSLRRKYGDLLKTNIMGEKFILVLNPDIAQEVLRLSPEHFGPGSFKNRVFKQFMPENVGISKNMQDWKRKRTFNEKVLGFNPNGSGSGFGCPHINDPSDALDGPYKGTCKNPLFSIIDTKISNFVVNNTAPLTSDDFINWSKRLTFDIVYGIKYDYNNPSHQAMFDIYQQAQSFASLRGYDNVSPTTKRLSNDFLKYALAKNMPGTLMFMANYYKNVSTNIVLDQLHHWTFPIKNIIMNILPVSIAMLLSDKQRYQKLLYEVRYLQPSITRTDTYLHWCVLELIRLFNIVNTLMRTTTSDSVTLNEGITFKKGDQLFILFADILRNEKYFKHPNKFIPERWEEPRNSHLPFFMIFSNGTQTCPGANMSVHILKSMLYWLLSKHNYRMDKSIIQKDGTVPYGINQFKIILT